MPISFLSLLCRLVPTVRSRPRSIKSTKTGVSSRSIPFTFLLPSMLTPVYCFLFSAGPYIFEVSPSAVGGDWVTMTVQQNGSSRRLSFFLLSLSLPHPLPVSLALPSVPGKFLGLSTAVAQDFPVQATIPAGTSSSLFLSYSSPLLARLFSDSSPRPFPVFQSAPEEPTVKPASSELRTKLFVSRSRSFSSLPSIADFPFFLVPHLVSQLAGPFGSCFAVTQAQGAASTAAGGAKGALKAKRRMGVYSNALVRRVEGIAVSWEKYVAKKV